MKIFSHQTILQEMALGSCVLFSLSPILTFLGFSMDTYMVASI